MLGSGYTVLNKGNWGKTVQSNNVDAYKNTDSYTSAISSNPGSFLSFLSFFFCLLFVLPFIQKKKKNSQLLFNIPVDYVFIMLGSNDAKPSYWTNSTQFYNDYVALIQTFKNLAKKPTVFLVTSPTAYGSLTSIDSSTLNNVVVPLERKIAADVQFLLSLFYHVLMLKL